MKIYLFDSWKLKFMRPVLEHWKAQGHEVQNHIWWGPDRTEWCQIAYFFPMDNNLRQASKLPKPDNTRVIVEAVDVDIYHGAGWRKIDWDYVDVLVSMSKHMIDYMHRNGLPDSVKVVHVPGGVDLDRWTLRTGPQGYNVVWLGARHWIAKNLFGALQIFNQLIIQDGENPWRLFVRADKWSPNWWKEHCLAYLEDNPHLAERVTLVKQRVPDLNAWLDDKDFLLQTSFKEAFGYVVAESAAKGIRPVIQFTKGVRDIWPNHWIFSTHGQAVQHFRLKEHKEERGQNRTYIAEHYPLSQRLEMLDEICFGDLANV